VFRRRRASIVGEKPALLAVARVDKFKRAEAGQRPVHEEHLDREIGLDVGLA